MEKVCSVYIDGICARDCRKASAEMPLFIFRLSDVAFEGVCVYPWQTKDRIPISKEERERERF